MEKTFFLNNDKKLIESSCITVLKRYNYLSHNTIVTHASDKGHKQSPLLLIACLFKECNHIIGFHMFQIWFTLKRECPIELCKT